MFSINKINIVSYIIALVITSDFLWMLISGDRYNALLLKLYDARNLIFATSESDFIRQFDFFTSILVFIFSYELARNFLKYFGTCRLNRFRMSILKITESLKLNVNLSTIKFKGLYIRSKILALPYKFKKRK